MLEFSLRQIKLLDHLLNHEDSDIDDLLSVGSISLRTFQNEMIDMNEKLRECRLHLEITSNFNKGYQIKKNAGNEQIFECLKRQCHKYLNHELMILYGASPRITYIIRRFLYAKGYIQSYELKNELYISMATLTKDLKAVRQILSQYGIELITLPYHGMKIKGECYQIRSALIDFCDIYDIYEDEFYLEPMAFRQYGIQPDILKEVREKLLACFHKYRLNIKDQYFIDLYFFCLIQIAHADPTYQEVIGADRSLCYACAEEICQVMHIHASCAHFIYLLIISGIEDLSIEDIEYLHLSRQPKVLLDEVCSQMMEMYHLDLHKQDTIMKMICQNIILLLLYKDYHLSLKISQINNFDSLKNAPLSWSLSICILEKIKDLLGVSYNNIELVDLTVRNYGIIFSIQNKYKKIHLAIFSLHGKGAAETYYYKLAEFLRKYDIEMSFFSYYEIEAVDLSRYDNIIILGANKMNANDNHSQIIYLEHYEHISNEVLYSKLLSRHQIKNFSVKKLENKIEIHLSNENNQGIREMAHILNSFGYNETNCESMLDKMISINAQHFQFDPYIICLLWNRELRYSSFHFHFDHPLTIHGMNCYEIQVAIVDPKFNITTIKQGDSSLRRIQKRIDSNHLHHMQSRRRNKQ